MVNVLTVACTGVWGMGQRMSALTFRYRKIFKLTKVFSGVAAGVEEQAAPLRVATEVGTASLCGRSFFSVRSCLESLSIVGAPCLCAICCFVPRCK